MSCKLSKKGRNPGVVDKWLDKLDLYRKNVAYDETCLFRAVSEQLFNCQLFHERVRKEAIDYGRSHYDEFQHLESDEQEWQHHLDKLQKHMVICGHLEINLISRKYNRDVLIFHANRQQVYDVTKRGLTSLPLMLCLLDDDHYDAVYGKKQISDAGFCQSIMYKILYEEVFEIADVDNIVNAMLYEKSSLVDQVELDKCFDNNNEHEPKELKSTTVVAPFPFKVAKALDPTIYRNIEYDSWVEIRRELRLGDWYNGDEKLTLGTRCILHDPRSDETLDCYIQELHKDDNKCVVYLTKFAEKRVVKYSDLSPENDAKPWPLPYRFSKNLLISSPTSQSPLNDLKTIRKKNKEKRQQGNNTSDLSIALPSEKVDNVSDYVGAPLQIQNTNNNKVEDTESATLKVPQSEGLITPVTPDVNHYPQRYQWEQIHWPASVPYGLPQNTYFSQTPDPFIWPQGPPTPCYEYKPMVASAPVTPGIVPYHDTSYPFYFNCHVEQFAQYPNQTPLTPYLPPTSPISVPSTPVSAPPLPQNQQDCLSLPQGIVQNESMSYAPHANLPVEASYPQVLSLPSGSPVLYSTTPADMEMASVPSSSVVYTPGTPLEMSYVPFPGYVYSHNQNVSAVPWYQPTPISYNSQGFFFPPSFHFFACN